MNTYTISKKPVEVTCGVKLKRPLALQRYNPLPPDGKCRGVMMRLNLSRLEEGLGHEGFQCDHCARLVKYIPPR